MCGTAVLGCVLADQNAGDPARRPFRSRSLPAAVRRLGLTRGRQPTPRRLPGRSECHAGPCDEEGNADQCNHDEHPFIEYAMRRTRWRHDLADAPAHGRLSKSAHVLRVERLAALGATAGLQPPKAVPTLQTLRVVRHRPVARPPPHSVEQVPGADRAVPKVAAHRVKQDAALRRSEVTRHDTTVYDLSDLAVQLVSDRAAGS